LDHAFYTQVATDPTTRGQAFLVVVIGGVLHGVALRGRLGALGIWAGVLGALGGWLSLTLVVELVARLVGLRRGPRSVARPLGFATAPMFLLVLASYPDIALVVLTGAFVWSLLTSAVAIQAAYQTTRPWAAALTAAAFAVYMGFGLVLGILLATS